MIKKTNIAKSLVKVTVGQVPYVGQVVAEVINFIDAEIVNRRLEKLEEEINKRKMSIEEFESRISEFDEHQYYFVRNNLRYYLLNCIPESSKEFCRSVVRYIANEDEELQEEICEIIQNLNEQDINFIKLINSFIKSSNKNELNSKMSIANKKNENKDILHDRNIIFGENTIFLKDLNDFLHIPEGTLVNMLNSEYKISGKSTFDIMYLGLSIIKLERLGILQTEFLLTLGTSSPNNIDRIHITLLGQKILECFLNCDANIRGEENG